jgi:hypothetical protein
VAAKSKIDRAMAKGRSDSPAERLAWLNEVLQADQTAHPITGVVVDGFEETSSIVLLREGARAIVLPGSRALLDPRAVQAIVGAVIRRTLPLFTREDAGLIADVVWSLSTMRSIYDSIDSATDWGRSYLYTATSTPSIEDVEKQWRTFSLLKTEDRLADDTPPPPRVVPWEDAARLVIRPWFNRHVRHDLGHESLSEQRIASLMQLAGWSSLPKARSALTAHNPENNAETIQFRFYMVSADWEPSLDDDGDGL